MGTQTMNAPAGPEKLLHGQKYALWQELERRIRALYDVEPVLSTRPGKKWAYECRYRRASKTLCGLYANEDTLGLLLVFGEKERKEVEAIRSQLMPDTLSAYDAADVYRDGKWVMFDVGDAAQFADFERLLAVKRRPDRSV